MRKYILPEFGYYTDSSYKGRLPDGRWSWYVTEGEYLTDYREKVKEMKGES